MFLDDDEHRIGLGVLEDNDLLGHRRRALVDHSELEGRISNFLAEFLGRLVLGADSRVHSEGGGETLAGGDVLHGRLKGMTSF